METNDIILDNMTADEKLNIICRIRGINKNKMIKEIYEQINVFEFEDDDLKSGYIEEFYRSSTDGWSCGEEFGGYYIYLDKDLTLNEDELYEKGLKDGYTEDEIECLPAYQQILTSDCIEFVKLALECGVYELRIDIW